MSLNRGFAKIPNLVLDNMHLLDPAELALILAICRRQQEPCAPVFISNEAWVRLTGKSPRLLKAATRLLVSKGAIVTLHEMHATARQRRGEPMMMFDEEGLRKWLESQSAMGNEVRL